MIQSDRYKIGLAKDQSLVKLLQEFQRNPRSLSFVALAEQYRKQGLLAQALDILQEGLVFHPDLSSALVLQARIFFEQRKFASALEITDKILRKNSENVKAHKLRAEVFTRLGQRKQAVAALDIVVSLFPNDKEAIQALEELENLEFQQEIDRKRLHSRAYVELAPAKGKVEEFQVGSIAPLFATAPKNEASIQAGRGVSELEDEAASTDQEEPAIATKTIAELYLRQGLKTKAVKVLKKMLQQDPKNSWARETLQELETNGIVPPRDPSTRKEHHLAKKARFLEQLLLRFQSLRQV